jgi:hypothetical protein
MYICTVYNGSPYLPVSPCVSLPLSLPRFSSFCFPLSLFYCLSPPSVSPLSLSVCLPLSLTVSPIIILHLSHSPCSLFTLLFPFVSCLVFPLYLSSVYISIFPTSVFPTLSSSVSSSLSPYLPLSLCVFPLSLSRSVS